MDELRWGPGDVVRKWREQKGWTQRFLGERAGGLVRQTIADLESHGNPKRDTLERVARALGASVGEVYAGVPVSFRNDRERKALELFAKLRGPRQERALVLLEEEWGAQAIETDEGV